MKYLDSLVSKINDKLSEGLGSLPVRKSALTFVVKDKNEIGIHDYAGKRVFADDKYDIYFYHRLKSKDYTQAISHGMVNKFHAQPSLDLIVFSKMDSLDYFESKLNEFDNLRLNSMDNDSKKIYEQEIGVTGHVKDYDFLKYFIYSINYTLNYKLEKCLEL
jgi:hypothetical protein